MKFSMLWLNDYFNGNLSPEEVADLLTTGGLEVEGIEREVDNVVLDAEVTTNRYDWNCIFGIAR